MATRAVLILILAAPVAAQESAKYPKVNAAVAYQVDAAWPKKPTHLKWAEMPGIAVDAQDRVYLCTRTETPIQVYDAEGNFLHAFGQGVLSPGAAHHLKIDPEGNLWAADIADHVVRKFSPEGKLLLTLGRPGVKGRDEVHLNQPTDMAITTSGHIFVADGYGNARIVHFDKTGKFIKAWGELGSKPGQFSIPHAIAADSRGRLYVADRNNVRVQVFDQAGKLLDEWRNLLVPWGFCITKQDEIWVCGSSPMQWRKEDSALGCPPKDQVFMKFNSDGKLLQLWTVPKAANGMEKPGECNWVHCIATDSKGNLYVGDILGKRAQKFLRVEPSATP